MKNLANCKPSEFLRQTSLIRKSVANWLTVTEVMEIRKRLPSLIPIKAEMSDEEKEKAAAENMRRRNEQIRKNALDILSSVLDEHPDETLELLALLCFVDPAEVDDHSVEEYLEAFTELINSQAVVNFFISLARLANLDSMTQ